MCLNKRVLIGLGAAALVILAISPRGFASAAPLLMFAVCPLSMLLMARGMNRPKEHTTAHDPRASEPAQPPTAMEDAETSAHRTRELEEEINRLRAELHLRDQPRSN